MASEEHSGVGRALPSLQGGCIYLDWNGTTPIYPEAKEAMLPFLDEPGNPSSGHDYGRRCKAAVSDARAAVADLVAAKSEEIYFTSTGTESDHWAIYGAVTATRLRWKFERVPHIVASIVEHPAVIAYLSHLAQQRLATHTLVPVDGDGLVAYEDVLVAITPDTVLVSVMHSNNEIGSIQRIKQIATAVRESCPHILIHTDAAQSIGKVELNVKELNVHLMTIVGHKFGAPKGVAALYIESGVTTNELSNFLHGGGQEFGRRAGTENVLLVVGMGAAARVVKQELGAMSAHMAAMRDRLEAKLVSSLPKESVRINGPAHVTGGRLPNTLSISVRGLNSSVVLSNLTDKLAASAGAACHSGGGTISAVLRAINTPQEFAYGTLRLSCGRHTTIKEVDAAVEHILNEAVAQGIAVAQT